MTVPAILTEQRSEESREALQLRHTFDRAGEGQPAQFLFRAFTKSGLPIGLQIIGRTLDESTVLRAARAYERATDWHTRRPNVG